MSSFSLFPLRASLLAALSITFVSGSARGADQDSNNLATADNGAYIVYSAPLKGGASANFLTQDGSRKLAFAGQSGFKLIVLDLGKTYALGNVRLNFTNPVKYEVYVLSGKPDHGGWASVLGGKPDFVSDSAGLKDFLNGRQGRYIVFVTDGDPGLFYGLYVTGVYVPYPNGGAEFARIYPVHNPSEDGYGAGDQGALPEAPISEKDYHPAVFPPSP